MTSGNPKAAKVNEAFGSASKSRWSTSKVVTLFTAPSFNVAPPTCLSCSPFFNLTTCFTVVRLAGSGFPYQYFCIQPNQLPSLERPGPAPNKLSLILMNDPVFLGGNKDPCFADQLDWSGIGREIARELKV